MTYGVLDWTFCVIHTFCAIQSWWRFRRPGEDFPEPWQEHVEVVATFRKRCADMLKEFHKRYQATHYYIACDCPRSEIWRLKLDPNYKSNRSNSKISKEGKDVWGEVFRQALEVLEETWSDMYTVMRVPGAEADDCVAVVCDVLREKEAEAVVHVVTGDSDLYQLEAKKGITVWDRKGKLWSERLKNVDPKHYIEAKCYAGDSADGIPSVGTRIGLKTALGWVTGTKPFPKDAARINRERLEVNRNLILFERIPDEIKRSIIGIL